MNNTLILYFIKFGHLVLPEIGTLKWHKQEAYWESNTLIAPKEQIVLEQVYEKPSKQFYSFVADDLGLSIEQATLQFEAYLNEFTNQTIASLNIGNLGTLHKNASQYSWNNLYNGENYYKNITPVAASVEVEEHSQASTKKLNSWVIWTIVITLIAVSLILYKQL
jgi:hypothetical protein